MYALMSLRDADDINMSPDYKKSASKVDTDFARAYLRTGEIRILNDAGLQRTANRFDQKQSAPAHDPLMLEYILPSWVLDWQKDRPYMQLGGSNRVKFAASTDMFPNIRFIEHSPKVHILDSVIEAVKSSQGAVDVCVHADGALAYPNHEARRASIVALGAFYDSHHDSFDEHVKEEDSVKVFSQMIMVRARRGFVSKSERNSGYGRSMAAI